MLYSVYVQQIVPGELSTQRRNLLGVLMGLHENEGKFYFASAAFIFAIALLVLYFSDIIITLVAMKKERKMQILTIIFGVIFFGILGVLSAT